VAQRVRTQLGRMTVDRSPVASFEAAWLAVEAAYPYLAYKRIDWRRLHEPYRRRAEAARPEQTLGLLVDLLAELCDGHVFLKTGPGAHRVPYVPPRMARSLRTFQPRLVHRYLDGGPWTAARGRLTFGLLPDRVGYLYLSAFEPAGVVAECDEALASLRGTRALVVDNRSCAGGHRAAVYGILSRFLRAPFEAPPWYTLGERRQWPAITPACAQRYLRRVVVLANGLTFSAAELFTDLMMRLPDVTVVGETTAGGSGGWDEDAVGDFPLANGYRVRVPTVDGRRADGTPWETVGVRPNVMAPQSELDLAAGRDRQLECALQLLSGP
jgi:hypothetical protein